MSAREIASIAFGRLRSGTIVCLRVYLDGSGKEADHPVITVGGFFADAWLCEKMEGEWEDATGGRIFHLADFGTPQCQLGSGDWSLPRRVNFLKRLAAIINRSGCVIVSASLEVAPYNEMLAEDPHAHVNGPASSGCAQSAVAVSEYVLGLQGRRQQKVHYIFEKGDREHEVAKMMWDWDDINSSLSGLRGHAFEPKETTLLQPADLVAGTVQRCVLSAYRVLPCLDNGMSRTALCNFQHHYSKDGVTAAVVSGHDQERCWIINSLSFSVLNRVSTEFFARHPEVLSKRLKQSPFKPRQERKP